MTSSALITLSLVTLAYAMISKWVKRLPLTAPMVYVAAGVAVSGQFLDALHLDVEPEALHLIAELTLIFLLFADASRIDVVKLCRSRALPIRLLLIGMPLSVLLGLSIGWGLFPAWPIGSVLVLAALLTPTDAALGQAIVEDDRLPEHVRRGLSVESGLNDGIAVPIVVIGIAMSAASVTHDSGHWIAFGLMQVLLGPVVGAACGLVGGKTLQWAESRGMVENAHKAIAGLAMAILAYALAEAVGGNGFISVFVAGMTIGYAAPDACARFHAFVENEGQVLMFLVFLLVGAVYALPALESATPIVWLFAILSLTVVRMVPVWLSLIGTQMEGGSKLILAWFGPRGIASVVFAIVALESEHLPMREEIFNIAILTVLMSVFLHGMTATPAASLFSKFAIKATSRPR